MLTEPEILVLDETTSRADELTVSSGSGSGKGGTTSRVLDWQCVYHQLYVSRLKGEKI